MGTLTVQTLQAPTSGANANKVLIPSGHTLDASNGLTTPAGHVIQVQRSTLNAITSTTSTSYVASGLGVTITPKFSTSKLFISVNLARPSIQNTGRQMDFKMYEGSSAIDANRLGSLYHNAGSGVAIYYGSTAYNLYLDATNTNARTYNLYYKAYGGDCHINDATDVVSAMIVMEIAA